MNQFKLLLVDDYEAVLFPMEYFFQKQGYAVWTRANGAAAVSLAPSVDAVLMDTDMRPGIPGYEACKQMRALPNGRSLVIIGMSGDDCYQKAWLDAGADDFVVKSQLSLNGLDALHHMIQDHFSARNSRA